MSLPLPENNFTDKDYFFMQRAILLAKKGHFTTSPNPRVGCLLVKNNEIIGEGFHEKAGCGHAEVNALAQVKLKQSSDKNINTSGATAYVTLEPCSHYGRTPPCAEALIKTNVVKVIVAMTDPNPQVSGRGIAMLEEAGIEVKSGLLAKEAMSLNKGFIHLMTKKRPYIRCKLAASLDGKTAMANGESKWITSSEARVDVQRLRAQSCAIISGADSIITDNARMTVRWSQLGPLKASYPEKNVRQPVRIIIDSQNRITPDLALFEQPSKIYLIRHTIEKSTQWPHFVEQIALPVKKNSQGQDKIDLAALVQFIGQQGLNDVLIESGANLAGAFIAENLVDELTLYQAPKIMGASAKGLISLPDVTHLADAKSINIADIRMVGKDIRITATFDE